MSRASIAPQDVLGPVMDAFERLRHAGMVDHLGLTGTGNPEAVREVIHSGRFETLQVPFNILNPSAGAECEIAGEVNYGNLIADCAARGMGVFAIRVFARRGAGRAASQCTHPEDTLLPARTVSAQ